MKRLTVLAAIAAIGITTAGTVSGTTVVQAASASEKCSTNFNGIYRVENVKDLESVKNWINSICNNGGTIIWPGENQPGTDKPDTDNSGTENPDTDTTELTYAQQVVKLVNEERMKAGLSALSMEEDISSAALIRSKEIETSFSHTRPDGRTFSTVLTDNGIKYKGSGENIAWGQSTPEEVVTAWMNSSGHRANILNAKFTKIGVGHYQNTSGRNYWTQLFTY